MNHQTKITLIRHATLIIEMNGKKILIDPMLSEKEKLDPVQNCGNEIRFPMVDLPITNAALTDLLAEIDAVVVSHLHRDHWDITAQELIDKNKPVFCQPNDKQKIEEQGFKNVVPIADSIVWEEISITRTKGQHGEGEIGKKMGEVSGFIFNHENELIYLAGDTIWCEDVEKALSQFEPNITILNAGGAKFLTGNPITMTPEDILKVHGKLPQTKIIAVHMDTVNHCFVKRTDLLKVVAENKLEAQILIPYDGETISA